MTRGRSGPFDDVTLSDVRRVISAMSDQLGALQEAVATLTAENAALKAENEALKDEIARLKGLPPRPKFKLRPSGMPTNAVLRADPIIVTVADACATQRAEEDRPVLRLSAETRYAAKSWKHERRVVARIEGPVRNFVREAIRWNGKDHRYGDREGRFGPAAGWP